MQRSPHALWGGVLGFGLGGFFDGIVLHQLLQWHHFFSYVPGWRDDIRGLILWDGLFHVLTYLVTAIGLWGLWRARRREEVSGRFLFGAMTIGFGLWNVVDIVVFHWIIGIHQIRVDTTNPLAYDIGWLVAFGAVPLVVGALLMRGGRGDGELRAATLASLSLLTGLAGLWSGMPSADQQFVTVVFRPGLGPPAAMAAIAAADARLVWTNADMSVAVVEATPERRWSFYRNGALLVGGTGAPAGCLDWSRKRA